MGFKKDPFELTRLVASLEQVVVEQFGVIQVIGVVCIIRAVHLH